jgi:hypothetical protein
LTLMQEFPHGWPFVQCLQHESPPFFDRTSSSTDASTGRPGHGV